MKKGRVTIDRNSIFQMVQDDVAELTPVEQVIDSWQNCFSFKASGPDSKGLRPAQLGALFSIKAHWTVSNGPATIVMPTGTGKTETMIATVVSEQINRTLIIVPSNLLRKQTVEKFMSFGVLQELGVIDSAAQKPSVASLVTTPKELSDLQTILDNSNVIVTTMS